MARIPLEDTPIYAQLMKEQAAIEIYEAFFFPQPELEPLKPMFTHNE